MSRAASNTAWQRGMILSELDVPAVAERVDMIQIGSRNMQNFALLAVGRQECRSS